MEHKTFNVQNPQTKRNQKEVLVWSHKDLNRDIFVRSFWMCSVLKQTLKALVVQTRSSKTVIQPGLLSYQAEKAFSKKNGILGKSVGHGVGQKTGLDYSL